MNIDIDSKVDKGDRPLTRADVESLLQKVGSSDKLNLSGRNLSGIDLIDFNLEGANLTRANLMGAKLENANLTGALLKRADLTGANLTKALLERAILREANLTEANLTEARLDTVDLTGANLTKALLERAILREANLTEANLTEARLERAVLWETRMKRANLTGANLTGAKLENANLTKVNLTGANLERAILWKADLTGAIGLTPNEPKQIEITAENTEKTPETTIKQTGDNATIQIRIDEEPLTALSLTSTLTNFIKLYTTYWLIQQERFDDALQYANYGGKHFEEEAHLIIGELKYNSPADIKFNIDLSPESMVNALKNLIDTIVQIKHRRKASELDNQAKELENRDKGIDLDKKVRDYAIEEIEKLIDLSAKIDPATSTALKQRLAEQLLQLCANPAVDITLLLPDTSTKHGQQTDNSLDQHINHAKGQSSIVEPLLSLPERNNLFPMIIPEKQSQERNHHMDPVTTAIIAALSAGTIAGLTDTAKAAITDSYNKLKMAMQKRFGQEHAVVKALEGVEAKPTSQGRQGTLVEEITEAGADQDAELLSLAEHIRQLLKEYAKDNTAVQQIITGDYNATSVHGDATVTVHAPKDV